MSLKTKLANQIFLLLFFYVVFLVSFILLISAMIYGNSGLENLKSLQIDFFKILSVLAVIFLAIGFFISRLVVRETARTLEQIIQVIDDVSKGELSKRATSNNSALQNLVDEVNKMIEETVKMKQHYDEQIKRAQELDKIKSEFISIAAHQLRTPLSAIKWTIKMMIDGDVGDITLEQKEFLKRGYATNERMISLVNDLLNVSRIEEGRFGYEFKPVAIENIIDNLLKIIQPLIQEKRINFIFNKPADELPKINADEEKLLLALENILNNAIKYTPPQGKITLLVKENDDKIELTVSDTGVGVPKDQLPKLFTKFFRGSNVIRLQTDGSGLGLFITKNIIEKHKGQISLQSMENKGATIQITLPIIELRAASMEKRFEKFIESF